MAAPRRWWERHWLAPFVVMLLIHRWFNLSDAVMVEPAPGEVFWPGYNFAMVAAFYAGVLGYVLHAAAMLERGLAWLAVKLAVLAVAWKLLLIVMDGRN